MSQQIYHPITAEQARRRTELAPEIHDAFTSFSEAVFADGALPAKTKQLIAVAVAHVTQCPYCIQGHTRLALRAGAEPRELMEAIWVAAEMRAGAAYAHSTLAIAQLPAGWESAKPQVPAEEEELDVRSEPPARRHELIFGTYAALAPGSTFVLVNDHDPKPLRYQFEAEHAGRFTWTYLEEGPQTWRVRIGRTD